MSSCTWRFLDDTSSTVHRESMNGANYSGVLANNPSITKRWSRVTRWSIWVGSRNTISVVRRACTNSRSTRSSCSRIQSPIVELYSTIASIKGDNYCSYEWRVEISLSKLSCTLWMIRWLLAISCNVRLNLGLHNLPIMFSAVRSWRLAIRPQTSLGKADTTCPRTDRKLIPRATFLWLRAAN